MALFYDSGTEVRWPGAFSLVLSLIESTRPAGSNLAGATPQVVGIAQFPMLGARAKG